MTQVHKTELKGVPAAVEGRTDICVEVYGTQGIPPKAISARAKLLGEGGGDEKRARVEPAASQQQPQQVYQQTGYPMQPAHFRGPMAPYGSMPPSPGFGMYQQSPYGMMGQPPRPGPPGFNNFAPAPPRGMVQHPGMFGGSYGRPPGGFYNMPPRMGMPPRMPPRGPGPVPSPAQQYPPAAAPAAPTYPPARPAEPAVAAPSPSQYTPAPSPYPPASAAAQYPPVQPAPTHPRGIPTNAPPGMAEAAAAAVARAANTTTPGVNMVYSSTLSMEESRAQLPRYNGAAIPPP